ncbi:phasin family protein [Shimia sediminis]|uniref:phasin family protein n=1 Tax=Shimia sediminis TaxID=2497945 RepID=UPI000F8E642A|nr:phasin family protein [Shimia sediminis]
MAASKPKDTKTPETTQAAAMAALNPMAAKVWQDIMAESVRFMTERLDKDKETQKALLSCKSPTELMQVQAEFYQEALSDYTQQTTRMLQLMSQTGAKRSYDDVPL